jgi:transcriptional regulator with XRE-family HTH domain
MKENSKNLYEEINDFFLSPPTSNEKAWDIINDFYHMILTFMNERGISRADLAKRLGKSRASISHMFNKTPNLTVMKMVEISDAIGVDLKIIPQKIQIEKRPVEESKNTIVLKVNVLIEKPDEYSTEYVSGKKFSCLNTDDVFNTKLPFVENKYFIKYHSNLVN